MEALVYTVLSIFAVYGVYAAARELVLFLQRLHGRSEEKDERTLCGGCAGCPYAAEPEESEAEAPTEEDDEDRDFFRT